MRIPSPLSRHSLESALLEIASRRRLEWYNAADYKTLGAVEGIAHELSHELDLGPDFELSLRAMGDDEANKHEAATLRIERAALALLGVRLSPRRLWLTANWQEIGKPPLSQLKKPLTRHERRCVERFVRLVQRTASSDAR